MIKRRLWIPCSTEEDPKQKMLWSASRIVTNLKAENCPYCSDSKLRFYYHEFEVLKPSRRGTLWVWCNNCNHWLHISGVKLEANVRYVRTKSDQEIAECEKKHRLLDTLNYFWENETIPHEFCLE